MDASTLISGIAVVIAIMSFVVGTWRAQRAELRARKPASVTVPGTITRGDTLAVLA